MPFTGAIFNATTGGTKLADLGLSCLYVGGGGNTASAPNANPDGPDTIFGISSCPGNTLNLAAHAGTGATGGNNNGWGGHLIGTDCSLGPYTTKSCTRTNVPCTTDNDCAVGAAGLCNPDPRCIFGPPLPVPAGPTSTCVLNVIRADTTGSIPDKTVGNSNITIPLSSYVYLVSNSEKFCRNGADGKAGVGAGIPFGRCVADGDCADLAGGTGVCATEPTCPLCDPFGTGTNHCISGKNHGQPCSPVGLKKTTADCLPRDIEFLGPLGVDLAPLGTGTTTLTAVSNPSRSNQFFFCPVGGAGTCIPPVPVPPLTSPPLGSTCQRTQGCFGRATCKRIEESGATAGNLTDNLAHPVTIAAVFCIPASGSALVDGGTGADLPGPGAVSIRGTFQITP